VSRATWAGIAYFGIVFAVGFALGTVLVLVVAPAIGPFGAALLETPFILAASWLVCGWLISRLALTSRFRARLWMGTVAFILVIGVEAGLGVYGFGRGWAGQIQAFIQPAGLVGLSGQILFALMPLVRRRPAGPGRTASTRRER
jgi:hypothetical protein